MSYFSNREQFVQFHETHSSMEKIKCGVPVPQGSILGPLFILYINDLPNALELTESYLFADDTSIYAMVYHSNLDSKQLELVLILNTELQKLDVWMKSNKLSVNITKTNYIVFSTETKGTEFEFICPICQSYNYGEKAYKIKFLVVVLLNVCLGRNI